MWSAEKFLGWVNAPFAWLMGIPWEHCVTVGQTLGERVVLNEFIGYFSLSQFKPFDWNAYATWAACAQVTGSF